MANEAVTLVTGGAGDIGRCICSRALASDGQVVATDVRSDALDELQQALGSSTRLHTMVLDVSDHDMVGATIEKIEASIGPIERLAHCAGVSEVVPALELSPAAWRRFIDINLNGTFWCNQTVARRMVGRGSGRIVNLASVAGKVGGLEVGPHYAASKAGVISVTFSLAKACAAAGVVVNAVAPGVIDSSMTADLPPEVKERYRARIPVGHYGTPEDVAAVVEWLLFQAPQYITGEVIDVNGGLHVD